MDGNYGLEQHNKVYAIQYNMRVQYLFILLLTSIDAQTITANLSVVSYQPLQFALQFSEKVQRPIFQLMFNNIDTLTYRFTTNDTISDLFRFQSDFALDHQSFESYQLIFNYPTSVAYGRLNSGSQLLSARKSQVTVSFNSVYGTVAVTLSYFLLNFTVLGHISIEFLQIYCLLMFRLQLKTDLYEKMSKLLLLLNPFLDKQAYDNVETYYSLIAIPTILLLATGLAGYVLKRGLEGRQKSVVCRIFYEFLVYNLFLNVGITFSISLLFNAIQFYTLMESGVIPPNSTASIFGYVFSYLNLVLAFFFAYLASNVLNPKPYQSQESYTAYLKSQSFDNFRILHEIIHLSPWYKRNKILFVLLKRYALVLLFFWSDGFPAIVLLMEFANILLIFTVRPYRYEVYMNVAVVCRVLLFAFYIILVVGNLYFTLGHQTLNYNAFKAYLVARDIVFLAILVFIILFVGYELQQKFANLNYQIRLVREENEFKLQIIEKRKGEEEVVVRRHHLRSSYDEEMLDGNYKIINLDDSQVKEGNSEDDSDSRRERKQSSGKSQRHNRLSLHSKKIASGRQAVNLLLNRQIELEDKKVMQKQSTLERELEGDRSTAKGGKPNGRKDSLPDERVRRRVDD